MWFVFLHVIFGQSLTFREYFFMVAGTPKGMSFSDVKKSFYAIQGVKEVHNLRVWSLTISKMALSAHIAVGKSRSVPKM